MRFRSVIVLFLIAFLLWVPSVLAQKRVYATVNPNATVINGTADLYNPNGSGFSRVSGQMNVPRESYIGLLLRDGRVLIAGGYNGHYLDSAEIFDPATGSFSVTTTQTTTPSGGTTTTTTTMTSGRSHAGSVVLPGGRVLIAGGFNGAYLSTAELFDPSTGIFGITTGVMSANRADCTATLLSGTGQVLVSGSAISSNGVVLLTGGYNGTWLNSAELYNPANSSFATTGTMTVARRGHTATLLSNGKVLLTGGENLDTSTNASIILNSAELFDPVAGTFSATGNMTTARIYHTATLLPDGKVLIAGGTGGTNGNPLNSAEIYDPSTGQFTATGSMSAARSGHAAAAVPGGKILMAGGLSTSQYLASAELFDPSRGTFTPVSSSMAAPRYRLPAVILNDGRVLLAGGQNSSLLSFDINDNPSDNVSSNIVFSPDGKTGFVSYAGSGVVLAFSVQTGQVVKQINTGGTPAFITPLKDGKTLAVASVFDSRIFLVGMDTLTVKKTYNFANALFGWGSILALSPDGTRGYISSTGSGEVIKFDINTGAESTRLRQWTDPSGAAKSLQTPGQITVTPDGSMLLVVDTSPSELDFVDAGTMAVKYQFAPKSDTKTLWNGTPYATAFAASNFTISNRAVLSPDGSSGVIGSQDTNSTSTSTLFVFKTSNGQIIDIQQIGYLPGYTGLTPDGQHWVVLNQNSLATVPTSDPASAVDVSTVQGNPLGSANIAFSPDSRYAYYSSTQNYVFQHDLTTQGVVYQVQIGNESPNVSLDQPSSVAITPDGSTIAVLNFMSNDISLLTDIALLNQTKFISSGNQFTGLSVVNLSNTPTNLTLTVYNDSGVALAATSAVNPNLVNPVTMPLGPNAQISVELSQVFNFDISQQNIGRLTVAADQPAVVAYAVLGEVHPTWLGAFLSRMDGLVLAKDQVHNLIIPEVVNTTGSSIELNFLNPNYNGSTWDLTGYGQDGAAVNTKTGNNTSANSRSSQHATDFVSTTLDTKVLLIGGVGCPSSNLKTTTSGSGGAVTGVTITSPGSGYTTAPTVTFSAPASGTTATGTATLNGSGGVAGITVTNGGSGYTTVPTVTLTAPGGSGTQATAVATISSGATTSCSSTSTLNTAELFDATAKSFSATTGSMGATRQGHTAVQMYDGKVLVAGGKNDTTILNSAEVWDPAANAFMATTGTMSVERYRHTATLLNDGTVLIAGGQNSTSISDTAELYDPSAGAFSATSNRMSGPRDSHTATLLNDGTVLIAGGISGNGVVASAEIYNPATSSFAPTGQMHVNRSFQSACRLANGKVLIAGGYNGSYLNSAEIYDPATRTFTSIANMTQARSNHTCTLLNDGTVLITGGTNSSGTLSSAEIYDPSSSVFLQTNSLMTQPRAFQSASLLSDNTVLIAGGTNGNTAQNTAEIFDPLTQSFTSVTGTMTGARQGQTATFLQSGINGYFRVSAPVGLMFSEVFNEGNSGSALSGIDVDQFAGVKALYFPQFAMVPGLNTVLNVINGNQNQPAQVTLTLHSPDGSVLSTPVTRLLKENGQLKDNLANIFQNDPALQNAVGWLELQSSVDRVVGTVTFTNPNNTFFAPFQISSRPLSQFVFPLSIQDGTYETAVALLNTSSQPAHVRLELWGQNGSVQQSASVTLNPRTRTALYLPDYFPGLTSASSGNLRIHSDQPLYGISLMHDHGLNFMCSVPAVPLP